MRCSVTMPPSPATWRTSPTFGGALCPGTTPRRRSGADGSCRARRLRTGRVGCGAGVKLLISWPRGTRALCDAPLAAQDFSRHPPRTGHRAVHRRVLAIGFRCFPGEEERRIKRRPQLLPCVAAANRRIAVRAAREPISLPVVTEAATESLV